jgi:peptidoglycan/LPS O-acetylase OafA/YrhL
MMAWLAFILVPILIGVAMGYISRLTWRHRTKAWSLAAGHLLLVVFLLAALYVFGDLYGRVVFYEFLTGCGVALLVQVVVRKLEGSEHK